MSLFFFFQAEDGIRDGRVTGVQTCALPISGGHDVERTGTLAHQAWPTWDEALCQEDTVEIAVQVNGRVRGRVVLSHAASVEAARTAALSADGVASHVA